MHRWAILIAGSLLVSASSVSAQLAVNVGAINLEPDRAGQIVDIVVQNLGSTSVQDIYGLNFGMQIGDGTSGPRVTQVNLAPTNSIFAPYAINQTDQGSNGWIEFFGIDTGGASLELAPGSASVLARLTFDTTGVNPAAGPWPVTIDHAAGVRNTTQYVLQDGTTRNLDVVANGQVTIATDRPALSIVSQGNQVRLSWPSSPTGYRLESIGSLVTGTWQAVSAGVVSTGGESSVVLPISQATQFYRLRQ